MTAKGGIFLRKNILAICDEEQDYASHFLDYLSRNGGRENFPFEVRVFTERESWEHFLKQNSVSVLLVSQPFYERYAEGWESGQVIVLAEGGEGRRESSGSKSISPWRQWSEGFLNFPRSGGFFPRQPVWGSGRE